MKTLVSRFQDSIKGMPPETVALLLAVGLVLGVFPLAGIPTVLCLVAAAALRLNVAALQAINSISSPLQLALFIPLSRVGALVCRCPTVPAGAGVARIGTVAVQAIAGWGCVCLPAGILLYAVLICFFGRPVRRENLRAAA